MGKYYSIYLSDAYEANELTLLANTPDQAESLLHSMEQAARDIILDVNSDKIQF